MAQWGRTEFLCVSRTAKVGGVGWRWEREPSPDAHGGRRGRGEEPASGGARWGKSHGRIIRALTGRERSCGRTNGHVAIVPRPKAIQNRIGDELH